MFVTNAGTVACCGSAPEDCKCGGHSAQVENSAESSLVTNENAWREFYNESAPVTNARPFVSNAADTFDLNDEDMPVGGSLSAATAVWNWDPALTPR